MSSEPQQCRLPLVGRGEFPEIFETPGDIVIMDNLGSHKGTQCAAPSDRQVPSSSSCHPTVPI